MLRVHTRTGTFFTSFGGPVVHVEPSPNGKGRVLMVSMFIFGSGAASKDAGQLLFYQPI
jgi:hypothetical protein